MTKWVTEGGIKACGDYHKVWIKFFDKWEEYLLTSVNIVFVSYNWFLCLCDIEWEVNVVALTSSFAYPCVRSSWSRVELTLIEPMDRNVEHRWVIVEDLGRAVTHMDVPIENDNFLSTIILLGSSSGYSDIVKETEASHDVTMCMVTRRAHNGKGLVNQHL